MPEASSESPRRIRCPRTGATTCGAVWASSPARTDALSRFTTAYTALARLPRPNLQPVDLSALVERVARLETRKSIHVQPGDPVSLQADPDQLEQLLINLMRNAVDAALETGGSVHVGWQQNSHRVSVFVEDEGPGLANPSNLFVPFFTTKPQGSGIGLVLGRQIAEAHGGTLTLEPRPGARGGARADADARPLSNTTHRHGPLIPGDGRAHRPSTDSPLRG